MPLDTIVRRRKKAALLAATIVLTVLGSLMAPRIQAQTRQVPPSSVLFVIQGRITAIQGDLVSVKTPDGYPGGPGPHAQFVVSGPTFKVDISHARILLPDGKQADNRPLAAGDRIVVVLSGVVLSAAGPESPAPNSTRAGDQTNFASIVERVAESDKITTH
jgi:hypothetical protein